MPLPSAVVVAVKLVLVEIECALARVDTSILKVPKSAMLEAVAETTVASAALAVLAENFAAEANADAED